MPQTTGDTHTEDFKGAQPATVHAHSLCVCVWAVRSKVLIQKEQLGMRVDKKNKTDFKKKEVSSSVTIPL